MKRVAWLRANKSTERRERRVEGRQHVDDRATSTRGHSVKGQVSTDDERNARRKTKSTVHVKDRAISEDHHLERV